MARVCTVCGKGPVTGNNVSHANNRTKRRWYPNLQTVRVLVEGAPKRVRVCTQCLKSNRITKATWRRSRRSERCRGRQKKGTRGSPLSLPDAERPRSLGEQLDPGDVRAVARRGGPA